MLLVVVCLKYIFFTAPISKPHVRACRQAHLHTHHNERFPSNAYHFVSAYLASRSVSKLKNSNLTEERDFPAHRWEQRNTGSPGARTQAELLGRRVTRFVSFD